MTTTEIIKPAKSYERLDFYADLMIEKVKDMTHSVKAYMVEYFKAAKEEGIDEEEAKRYLRTKIPNSTFYKYLPAEISRDPSKQNRIRSTVEQNPEFNTEGMGVVPDDEPEPESSNASSSATDSDGQEVEQEIEQPIYPTREKIIEAVTVTQIKELKDEIAELTKALEEARRDNKVLAAANPDLSRWTDRERNLSNEVKKLLDENKTLRENQKPVVFNKASQMTSAKSYATAQHKDLLDIDILIHRSIRDGANIRFTVDNNTIIGYEVINFATQTQQTEETA